MRTDTASPTRLVDYQPPAFAIKSVDLAFSLDLLRTRVVSKLSVERQIAGAALRLDGETLELVRVSVDGRALSANEYTLDDASLTIHDLPDACVVETEVVINPTANTALSGLYISCGRFCTQCEAEGFRRITFYPDRPDVMSVFTVSVEADAASCPTLLVNGNLVEQSVTDGRNKAIWHDPWPKPAYLFALVGGAFDENHDSFTTMSGKKVHLGIYVDPGDASRTHYAMDAVKRSFAWDEEVFGREYDLDVFNIVAVRDFNFGAMENKGLNIFNSSLLLADPESATDVDYENIEAVIAHEYFHNWTGDRITLRDWFQLSLKEGLTVYRDQEFSSDQRSRAVKRIKDVKLLRARQFSEDGGPLAHAVRPASYMKIDNFYTATIYEKGSEVIRVLRTLLGDDAFKAGLDRYFERCDGTAATVEDFLECFEDAIGQSLDFFKIWYSQAGTPHVKARGAFDAATQSWALTLTQETPPTPGQPTKEPVPIPVRMGLLGADGRALPLVIDGHPNGTEEILKLTEKSQTWVFTGLSEAPTPSLLRGFSAPVILDAALDESALALLAAHDTDSFVRWEALQSIARRVLLAAGRDHNLPPLEALIAALGAALDQSATDPAYAALLLRLPDLPELIQSSTDADPDALKTGRDRVRAALALALHDKLAVVLDRYDGSKAFSPDAASAGIRALNAAALDLLVSLETSAVVARASAFFANANCLTDTMAALEALGGVGGETFDAALAAFYEAAKDRPLVLDKWFSVQAASAADDPVSRMGKLRAHPAFDLKNPNRVRSLAAAFSMRNPVGLHRADGAGYRFMADLAIAIDKGNPALSARLLGTLESWRKVEPARRARAETVLKGIAAEPALSANSREIVERMLG